MNQGEVLELLNKLNPNQVTTYIYYFVLAKDPEEIAKIRNIHLSKVKLSIYSILHHKNKLIQENHENIINSLQDLLIDSRIEGFLD